MNIVIFLRRRSQVWILKDPFSALISGDVAEKVEEKDGATPPQLLEVLIGAQILSNDYCNWRVDIACPR